MQPQRNAVELDSAAVERDVATALREDVGSGDINAELIASRIRAEAVVISRDEGVFCGAPWVDEACRQVDTAIDAHWHVLDGDPVAAGQTLLVLHGPARGLLTVERTIINFMQLLCATATRARRYVQAVHAPGAARTAGALQAAGACPVILDTRKTLPGLRLAQKYAVRVGGATNHRLGLYDAYLLKENHIAVAGGIGAAVRRAKQRHPDREVEVEVEDDAQLAEAINAGADRVLLDNYTSEDLRRAVAAAAGRVALEASGGITLETIAEVARTGVDYISVGEITKAVAPLDLSMRIVKTKG